MALFPEGSALRSWARPGAVRLSRWDSRLAYRWLRLLCLELRSELASQALLVRPSPAGLPLAPALGGRRRSSWRSTAWRRRMYTQGSRIWFHEARRTAKNSGRCRELEPQPPTASTTNTCGRSQCERSAGVREGKGTGQGWGRDGWERGRKVREL